MSIAVSFEPILSTLSDFNSASVLQISQWTVTAAFSINAPLTPASFMPNRLTGGLLALAHFFTVARRFPQLASKLH